MQLEHRNRFVLKAGKTNMELFVDTAGGQYQTRGTYYLKICNWYAKKPHYFTIINMYQT